MKGESLRGSPDFRKKVFVLGILCLFLVMVVTSIFGKKGFMDIHRARQRLAILDVQSRKLQQEKAKLETEILELKNDPRAVEKEARDKLWLIKPGEKVVVVPKVTKK